MDFGAGPSGRPANSMLPFIAAKAPASPQEEVSAAGLRDPSAISGKPFRRPCFGGAVPRQSPPAGLDSQRVWGGIRSRRVWPAKADFRLGKRRLFAAAIRADRRQGLAASKRRRLYFAAAIFAGAGGAVGAGVGAPQRCIGFGGSHLRSAKGRRSAMMRTDAPIGISSKSSTTSFDRIRMHPQLTGSPIFFPRAFRECKFLAPWRFCFALRGPRAKGCA